jgi:flagellum-specific ATP synthase
VTRANQLLENLRQADLLRVHGRVTRSLGQLIEASGPPAFVGEICRIRIDRNSEPVPAEVVGFGEGRILLMPWSSSAGVRPGAEIVGTGTALKVRTGDALLGRILDGLGRPLDGKGPLPYTAPRLVRGRTLNALERIAVREPLVTGIRSLDAFVTSAQGQRLGIFAGGGVGKSVLLGMIARSSRADVTVVALLGERGREVVDFLENELGEEGLARSVVVVATSEESALKRVQGARVAAAIAESFRDRGKKVLLLMDSLTRVAMAQREIGLAAGEPPTTRGYPPSSFAILPEIVERCGATREGSVTGFFSVLLEGDDIDAPLSDAARAVLDGHIVLSRELATAGLYPAVDILESVSRMKDDCQDEKMRAATQEVARVFAARREAADLLSIGAYKRGSNPLVDRALEIERDMREYLRQRRDEASSWEETRAALLEIMTKERKREEVPAR